MHRRAVTRARFGFDAPYRARTHSRRSLRAASEALQKRWSYNLAFRPRRVAIPRRCGLAWRLMPSANRCPNCRQTIHPFAATCPSCGADLDAHRRWAAGRRRWRQIEVPRLANNVTDLIVVALVMLLLALFAPLFGALLALFVGWQSNRTGLVARRNIAIVCGAIAIFNLAAPDVLLPHLI